jgi:NDP-sugar pyrophosphorylase family protein/aminoglycoside/choline kinase family phosphotransferase
VSKIRAFIPAAGYGERLLPITSYLPKPLMPILGTPVIENVLNRMSILAIDDVGINIHHKWKKLKEWATSSPYKGKITLFHEDSILGTGGALKNAASFLRDAPFLVHNADIVSDINLNFLVEEHLKSGNMATLAVHDHREFNNVWIDREGFLHAVARHSQENRRNLHAVAFTGIAVYSPDFLRFLPEGASSVVAAWLLAASSGMQVATVDFTGSRWSDIGTPDAYAGIVFERLRERGEVIYVDPSADCNNASLAANTVIEAGAVIGNTASLSNCIALPGARVSEATKLAYAIIGPDFVIPLIETAKVSPVLSSAAMASLTAFFEGTIGISPVGTGGSDRNYYRITKGDSSSAVLMECPRQDPDLQRHLVYTEFFGKHAVPVPKLLSADVIPPNILAGAGTVKTRYVLFEDLGDISLHSWLKCNRSGERIEAVFMRILGILAHLHGSVSGKVAECPLLGSRIFNYEHFRWETDYFCDRFVSGFLGITPQKREELDREFDRLAKDADCFEKTIVHRDFQSQNIMLPADDVPRIIDYQGARMGPPAYDLVSLLWDPYYKIDDAMRGRLVDYYISLMKKGSAGSFDANAFMRSIPSCRLQRHMQALGAYGFLSKAKGKTYFEKYIPAALHYLTKEAEAAENEYPVLFSLIKRINEKTYP